MEERGQDTLCLLATSHFSSLATVSSSPLSLVLSCPTLHILFCVELAFFFTLKKNYIAQEPKISENKKIMCFNKVLFINVVVS